ncbi:MAG: dockerin type I repeat-containing protein [Pseudomonadota bacterium]
MKRLVSGVNSLLFVFIFSSTSQAEVVLYDWGVNIDGTSYCLEGPCSFDFFSRRNLNNLSGLPSSIDYSEFNFTDLSSDRDGFGTLAITVTGVGPHSVSVYFNYDLDYSINYELNETGASSGTAPNGLSWEIDEIGWGNGGVYGTAGVLYTGDIFDNFVDSGVVPPPTSHFDDQIFFDRYPLPNGQSLVPPREDTALGQSWDFELVEGQTAIITFIAGATVPSGFYLVQQDPDTGTNVYLTSSLTFDSNCDGDFDCNGVCNGAAVVDDCGVCGGDNADKDCAGVCFGDAVTDCAGVCNGTSALDCLGTCNGTAIVDCTGTCNGSAVIDNCNVCVGGSTGLTGCVQDCAGNWGGSAMVDACGVCGGDNSTCAGCDGVANSGLVVDACGVCGGDNSTCAGCDGVANSGLVVDACGVCGGDNSTCADCNGVANGSAVVDQCGTCDADPANDCVQDCAGNWGGSAMVDACGVCGGDNSTCAGCDGVANSGLVVDACGVCGGDNSTCADCNGVANGSAVVDQCGTCDADPANDCVQDCAGNWGGSAMVDACGVCGGDNSTCTQGDLPGDINGDGIVNLKDLAMILKHLRKSSSLCGKCDLDGDGKITLLDARNWLLLKSQR